jgi:glycosyltransferase 2 family protein
MIDLIQKQDQEAFWNKINQINYGWIAFSLVIGLLSHLVRAHRWKYLLEPMGHETSFANRYHATMVGYVVNMVIPRAGEASRAGVLLKTNDVPFSKAFGTIIAERAIDLILLLVVGLITVSLSVEDFNLLYDKLLADGEKKDSKMLYILAGGFIFLALVGWIFFRKNVALRDKIWNLLDGVKTGLFSIFKSKKPGAFVFHSVLIWVLYIVYFGICFMALEETKNVPVQGVLMGFIAGTLGVMLTNGGVGVYPLFVGTVITFYAFPDYSGAHNTALALATVIWLTQTFFLIILGLISLGYISRKFPVDDAKSVE